MTNGMTGAVRLELDSDGTHHIGPWIWWLPAMCQTGLVTAFQTASGHPNNLTSHPGPVVRGAIS